MKIKEFIAEAVASQNDATFELGGGGTVTIRNDGDCVPKLELEMTYISLKGLKQLSKITRRFAKALAPRA